MVPGDLTERAPQHHAPVAAGAGLLDWTRSRIGIPLSNLARRWTTEAVPAAERFAYWREAVCEAIIGAETEDATRGFWARIATMRWGDRGFTLFSASPHLVIRSESLIRRSAEAPFLVSLQIEGESHYWQDGGTLQFRPGEVAVVDTARPFQVSFPRPVSRVIAIVPRSALGEVAWLRANTVNKISGSGAYVDLIRAYLAAPRAGDNTFAAPASARLVDHLAELVALAGGARDETREARPDRRQALFDHVALHLDDPHLSPRSAAAALGLSLRAVHKHFATRGTSFGRHLLESRLEASRADLADPAQADRTISAIAFARGFNDLSHFSRAFKARFGVSPRGARAKIAGN